MGNRGPVAKAADLRLAERALKKQQAGQEPTTREQAALDRVRAIREEQQRWEHYERIPKSYWVKMSGRQVKVINEQARRYGIPFDGEREGKKSFVNLPAVVESIHDFLVANARRLARKDDDGGHDSYDHWKKENEKAKAQRNQRRNELEAGRVITREEHDQQIDRLCGAFRAALLQAPQEVGPKLARKTARQAQKALTTWANKVVDSFFGKPQ